LFAKIRNEKVRFVLVEFNKNGVDFGILPYFPERVLAMKVCILCACFGGFIPVAVEL
jgi:hypothetical protein